jgi:ATP dependent DNA ligase domain
MPKSAFEPCIPTRGTTVPAGPAWLHEIKHDGYRLIFQRDGKRVRLFTRNGHDWSGRFPLISAAALRNSAAHSSSMARPYCSASTAAPISTGCIHAGTTMRSSSTPLTSWSATARTAAGYR